MIPIDQWRSEGMETGKPFFIRYNPKPITITKSDMSTMRSAEVDRLHHKFMSGYLMVRENLGAVAYDPKSMAMASQGIMNVTRLGPGIYSLTVSRGRKVWFSFIGVMILNTPVNKNGHAN